MDLGLTERRALVTGSSRGTGEAIARALAREGATVVVHGNTEGDQLRIASEIAGSGGSAIGVTGDVATDAGAERVAEAVDAELGGLDILVNNFGQAVGGTWSEAVPSEWVDIYERNTLSAVRMVRSFVEGMKARGWGRIVQVATIGATRPNARMPHYYASKAALANLTVSLAQELAGTGVTVNTVSPGLVRTPEVEQYMRYRARKKGWGEDWGVVERRGVEDLMPNPLRRMARVEEVADLVAFLVSERAGYVNGMQVRVDGGAAAVVG